MCNGYFDKQQYAVRQCRMVIQHPKKGMVKSKVELFSGQDDAAFKENALRNDVSELRKAPRRCDYMQQCAMHKTV